jgi:hypothetical protein
LQLSLNFLSRIRRIQILSFFLCFPMICLCCRNDHWLRPIGNTGDIAQPYHQRCQLTGRLCRMERLLETEPRGLGWSPLPAAAICLVLIYYPDAALLRETAFLPILLSLALVAVGLFSSRRAGDPTVMQELSTWAWWILVVVGAVLTAAFWLRAWVALLSVWALAASLDDFGRARNQERLQPTSRRRVTPDNVTSGKWLAHLKEPGQPCHRLA